MRQIGSLIYLLFIIITFKVGYEIHGSIFWSIVDFFLAPFAWIKWVIFQEVNVTIIKSAFAFFFQ